MKGLERMQRLPSVALAANRLDRLRGARLDALFEEQHNAVDEAKHALSRLIEAPHDHHAESALSDATCRVLKALRAPPPGESELARALRALDELVRTDRLELIDRPNVPERFKELTLRSLHRANQRSGSYDHWLTKVREVLAHAPSAHVYDLAAGTGGFARHVARVAPRTLRMTSSDRAARYVGLGMRAAEREGLMGIRWEVCDALDLRAARARSDVDLFLCTQAAHHFAPGQLVQLLGQALRAAAHGILVIDLMRSASTALGTAAAAALTAPWPGLVLDGFLSARRAYTPAEFSLLARLAGAQRVRAERLGMAWCTLHAALC